MVYSCIFVTQIMKQHECSKGNYNNIKDHKLISCWWKYKNIRNFRNFRFRSL